MLPTRYNVRMKAGYASLITVHTSNGDFKINSPENGALLSDLLRQNGLSPDMPCAGRGICGKCRVRAQGALSEVTAQEKALLSEEELSGEVRLACRTAVHGDAEITLPDTGSLHAVTEGRGAFFRLSPFGKRLGLAADIGTTTVAAYLYDLKTGVRLGARAVKNPQSAFGADVVSRQKHSLSGGGKELAAAVRGCISSLAKALADEAGQSISDIDAAVFCGNTTMIYLLMGYGVSDIAAAPFNASHLFGEFISGASLFPELAPDCRIYLPPCISAYVGSDTVCAVLASGMTESTHPVLLADIGTNGEMALFSESRLLCCSTAAGPAFEGAGIECGTGAVPGAIDRVRAENGNLKIHTLSDAPPCGICGSGLLDAANALLKTGRLDETGRFTSESEREYLSNSVYISQKDIRNIQLAKSAVRAGIETLLLRAGIAENTLPELYIAGGFGSLLSPESAAGIGMIPSGMLSSCTALGNAAGLGACDILLSEDALQKCGEIIRISRTLELASDAKFSESFIENMLF